jgi:tRNA(Ile)-lysidine synthase
MKPRSNFHDYIDQCAFPSKGELICAVSGGADSAALLILASEISSTVKAIHVNHGLRQEVSEEAKKVEMLADKLNVGFEEIKIELVDGPNLEERARDARYRVLPNEVLTGHTADDQAETVLLHLMRGGSLDALSGMRPSGHPLLRLRRCDTEAICNRFGYQPIFDPSNNNPRFLRNRVRHEILPLMADVAQRDVAPLFVRAADLARDDRDLLDELASVIDPTDVKELNSAPVPLARRAIRQWLRNDHPPDLAAVERVLEVARGNSLGTEIAGGKRIRRSKGKLHLFERISSEDEVSETSD